MLNIIFNGEDLDKVPVRVHKLWNKSLRSIHNNRRLHTPKSTTYLVIVGLIQQEVEIQTRRELVRHDMRENMVIYCNCAEGAYIPRQKNKTVSVRLSVCLSVCLSVRLSAIA